MPIDTGRKTFFVPPAARWSHLPCKRKAPAKFGKDVDDAMEAIEREENPTLKGILPKVYARPNLDKTALGGSRPEQTSRSGPKVLARMSSGPRL